jgi:hypothetical protein
MKKISDYFKPSFMVRRLRCMQHADPEPSRSSVDCHRLRVSLRHRPRWLSDILGGLGGGLAFVIASIVWIGPARAYSE